MPKFTIDGDGAGAVKAFTDVKRSIDGTTESVEVTVREMKKLEQAASQVVKANEGPLDKYNRKMAELDKLVKAGKLSYDEASAAAERYGKTLGRAGEAGAKAFNLRDLNLFVGGLKVAEMAADAVREALASVAAEREKAAAQTIAGRRGLGSISQLAAGTDDPEGNFKKWVDEAIGFVGMGAADNKDEAGNLFFQLKGADLGRRDRAFAAQLRAAGTLQNVGGAAEAFSALTTALGPKEVGTFQEFMSKSLRAAGPAPGSFEQLPMAASASGGSARALGVSDEFLLAATTILGKKTGSISEGGTQLSALLASVEKSGLDGVQGVGGMGIIDRLSKLPESQQGYGGPLGERKEAVEAFRTLRENRAALLALQSDVVDAQSSNLAGRAAGLPETVPQLRAARRAVEAKGRREVGAWDALSEPQLLLDSLLDDIAERRRRESPGRMTELLIWADSQVQKKVPFMTPEHMLRASQNNGDLQAADPALQRDILDYLKRSTIATEKISHRQGAKAATRDE